MEWYELDQLFNCTFPHVVNNDSLVWCNQGSKRFKYTYEKWFKINFKKYLGALCVYDGIDDKIWKEYGIVQKVSQISGDTFNNFANWSIYGLLS